MFKNYKITGENVLAHELIGLETLAVRDSKEVKGKIINETKNTFVIESNNKEIVLPKKETKFKIYLPEKQVVEVKGSLLTERPEDRIKVFWRKYHGKIQ